MSPIYNITGNNITIYINGENTPVIKNNEVPTENSWEEETDNWHNGYHGGSNCDNCHVDCSDGFSTSDDPMQHYGNISDDQAAMGIIPPRDEDIIPFTKEQIAALDAVPNAIWDGGKFVYEDHPSVLDKVTTVDVSFQGKSVGTVEAGVFVSRFFDGIANIPEEIVNCKPDHPDLNGNGIPDEIEALVGSVRIFSEFPDKQYTVFDVYPEPDDTGMWFLITQVRGTGYLGARELTKVLLDKIVTKE